MPGMEPYFHPEVGASSAVASPDSSREGAYATVGCAYSVRARQKYGQGEGRTMRGMGKRELAFVLSLESHNTMKAGRKDGGR